MQQAAMHQATNATTATATMPVTPPHDTQQAHHHPAQAQRADDAQEQPHGAQAASHVDFHGEESCLEFGAAGSSTSFIRSRQQHQFDEHHDPTSNGRDPCSSPSRSSHMLPRSRSEHRKLSGRRQVRSRSSSRGVARGRRQRKGKQRGKDAVRGRNASQPPRERDDSQINRPVGVDAFAAEGGNGARAEAEAEARRSGGQRAHRELDAHDSIGRLTSNSATVFIDGLAQIEGVAREADGTRFQEAHPRGASPAQNVDSAGAASLTDARQRGQQQVQDPKKRCHSGAHSELERNWGRTTLNARESDRQFKYHVARMATIYRGKSTIDNKTPKTLLSPPPALVDRIRERQEIEERPTSPVATRRETQPQQAHSTRKLASASQPHLPIANDGRPHKLQHSGELGASTRTTLSAQPRPKSAPSNSARSKPFYPAQSSTVTSKSSKVSENKQRVAGPDGLTREEQRIAEGTYFLTPSQQTIFQDFAVLLSDFDSFDAMHIVEDVVTKARELALLDDFAGEK